MMKMKVMKVMKNIDQGYSVRVNPKAAISLLSSLVCDILYNFPKRWYLALSCVSFLYMAEVFICLQW